MKICLLLSERDRKSIAKRLGVQGADFQCGLDGLLYATGLSQEAAAELLQRIGEGEAVPIYLGNEAALQLAPPLDCVAMETGIPAPPAGHVSAFGDNLMVELKDDCTHTRQILYGCFIKNLGTGEYQLMSESQDGPMEAWEAGLRAADQKQDGRNTLYDRKDVKILACENFLFSIGTGWRSLTVPEQDVLNYEQTFHCPPAIKRLGTCKPICNVEGKKK